MNDYQNPPQQPLQPYLVVACHECPPEQADIVNMGIGYAFMQVIDAKGNLNARDALNSLMAHYPKADLFSIIKMTDHMVSALTQEGLQP